MQGADRRRDFRFATHTRLEYVKAGKKTSSFAGNVSLRGLFIEDGRDLEVGDALTLTLHFDKRKPLPLTGRVVSCSAGGVHVEVAESDALRAHIREALLPKIEQAVSRAWPHVERMLAFARSQALDTPDEPSSEEQDLSPTSWHSTLLLERAAQSASEALPILHEVDSLVKAGASIGGSNVLSRFAQRLHELRIATGIRDGDRLTQLENELLARQERARTNEVKLVERERALEAAEERAERLQAELEETRERVTEELRAALTRTSALAAQVQEQEAWALIKQQVEAQESGLRSAREQLERQAQLLEEERAAVSARAGELASEREQLGRQRTSLTALREEALAMRLSLDQEQAALAGERVRLREEAARAQGNAGDEQRRLQNRIDALEASLAERERQARDYRETAARQLGEQSAHASELQRQLADLLEQLDLAEKRISHLTESSVENAMVRDVSASNSRTLASAQEELDRMRRALEQEKADIHQQRLQLELDRQALARQVRAAEARQAGREDKAMRGQSSNELEEARAKLRAERAALEAERRELMNAIALEKLEGATLPSPEPSLELAMPAPQMRPSPTPRAVPSMRVVWAAASAASVIAIAAMWIFRPSPPAPVPIVARQGETEGDEAASLPVIDEMVELKALEKKKRKAKNADQLFDAIFK